MPIVTPNSNKMLELAKTAQDKGLVDAAFVARLADGTVSHQDLRAAKKLVKDHGSDLTSALFDFVGSLAGGPSNSAPHDRLVRQLQTEVQARRDEQGFFRTLGETIRDMF
jgi:hypothetical protein